MRDDPAQSVRVKKDSSLVRGAEAVRDSRASAMVSAGNTGAAMASALLRMGRLPGVARPAIAALIPAVSGRPAVLVDAGANADCHAEWLVQFAQMGAAFMALRFGTVAPKVALLSIGEESSKGNQLTKEAHALLAGGVGVDFVGNVEGRDLLNGDVDVIVTDGFTGNVALKSLEGALRALFDIVGRVIGATPENRRRWRSARARPARLRAASRSRGDRRGDAAGRRRRLCDQPRELVLAGDPERGAGCP